MYCQDDCCAVQDGDVVISAYQELLDEKAAGNEFCWGYYLRIENNSDDKISLLGRKISVTDIKGRLVTVDFAGFNGEAPELNPGEVFEFEDYATSQASAVLCGSCQIRGQKNRQVRDIELPVLSLIANDNCGRILN